MPGYSWNDTSNGLLPEGSFSGGFNNSSGYDTMSGLGDLFGYSDNALFPTQYMASGINEGGDTSYLSNGFSANPELLSTLNNSSFSPTDDSYRWEAYNAKNTPMGTFKLGDKPTGFDNFANVALPMIISAGWGGPVSGALGGGFGGAIGGGMASGGINAAMNGQPIGKGMITGGVGAGVGAGVGGFNPAQYAGIENPTLASMFNRGTGSTVAALAQGQPLNNALKAGVTNAGIGGINSIGSNVSDFFKNTYDSLFSSGGSGQQDFSYSSNPAENASYPEGAISSSRGLYNQMTGQEQPQMSMPVSSMYSPSPYDVGSTAFNPLNSTGQETPQKTAQGTSAPNMFSNLGSTMGNYALNHAGDLASMLYGFYNNRRQQKQIGGQIQSLKDLYSGNSPYAQQLRAKLQASAAQRGTRANTAGREVQLQAALADRAAQTMPTQFLMQQAMGGLQNNNMNMLLQGLNKTGLLKAGFNGLQSMFQPQQTFQPDANTMGGLF